MFLGRLMYKLKRFSSNNTAITFLICLGISLFSVVLLSCIFALIANTSTDPTGNLGIFSLCTLLVSGAIGGFICAKIKKEKAMTFVALTALAVVLIMLIICIIISGKISGGAFMNYACYMGIASFSGFLGSREKKHKRHRR